MGYRGLIGAILLGVSTAAVPAGIGAAGPLSAGRLEAAIRASEVPMAIYATGQGAPAAVGAPAGDGPGLTIDTPLRIASNTKTFVAAAALRLHERGRLGLDAPIGPLIDPKLDAMLRADGYDTARITVRHLLSHSAGLYDQGADPRFIQTVLAAPEHVFKREDIVRLSMTYGDPLSAPGTEFKYSDTGYVLLGDIIERLTKQPLAAVVRRELRFDELGLKSTWWETVEAPPKGSRARGRQWIGDTEVTGVHPSMDLYGGGGLVMSTRDLATLTAALFEGRIFEKPETLRLMLWQGAHKDADQYRLGIFVKRVGDRDFYWHSGFWGTLVYYDPTKRVAVAAMTSNQKWFKPKVRPLVECLIGATTDPACAGG